MIPLKLTLLIAVGLLAGCGTASYTIEAPFNKKSLTWLQPGVTDKNHLFSELGPPAAIIGPDDELTKPYVLEADISPGAAWNYFQGKHAIYLHHRIYYYYYIDIGEFALIGALGSVATVSRSIDIHNLWVLLNDKGMVEDFSLTSNKAGK